MFYYVFAAKLCRNVARGFKQNIVTEHNANKKLDLLQNVHFDNVNMVISRIKKKIMKSFNTVVTPIIH